MSSYGLREPLGKKAGSQRDVPEAAPGDSREALHRVESDVRRQLLSQPKLQFSRLVVRRTDNGVCLQGLVVADDSSPDVCTLAQKVAGVQEVINQLLIMSPDASAVPRKG